MKLVLNKVCNANYCKSGPFYLTIIVKNNFVFKSFCNRLICLNVSVAVGQSTSNMYMCKYYLTSYNYGYR